MTNKKSTTAKNVNNNSVVNNETKVMCPVCGTEFAIGEHEHKVKNGIAIGKDSGMGDIYLPVAKRGDALKAAGIDTSKYFSIELPTGGSKMMRINDEGVPVAVADDDPIMQAIVRGGTVPSRSLFRRWIMSQTFHGLTARNGYATWLDWHGYDYQWEMLVEELRVQAKLYGKDMENYAARNRWFNQTLALAMAHNYIDQVEEDATSRKQHKCKGVPYVKFDHRDVFLTDIDKKLLQPLRSCLYPIATAKTPQELYVAVRNFWKVSWHTDYRYKQCKEWKDAFKGMGAYATMQNLLRFHGCHFPKNNEFYNRRLDGLTMLDNAAVAYKEEGWRLFGLMKQMLEENGIDIEQKMKEWSEAKAKRCAK